MSMCQACSAPLRWARTEGGRRIPLNRDPDEAGNVTLDRDGLAHVLGAEAAAEARAAGRLLYIPHHATCSHAGEFRSNRRRGARP